MRRWWVIAIVVVAVLAATGYWFRDLLGTAYLIYSSKPDVAFDAAEPPAPPDYTNPDSWAALPEREDAADAVPAGVTPTEPAQQAVDAFFIHPTTYYAATWNAPLDDAESRTRTDGGTIRSQASVFNGCCRVYAPRYRQATLYAFIDGGEGEEKATALAYQDVLAAFDHWQQHSSDGRPFIIASHSQGSRYALWLLEDRIEGTPLRQRFVAAYIVGYGIPNDWFERRLHSIAPCRGASDVGCVVSWNTFAEGATPERLAVVRHRYGDVWEVNGDKPRLCTNPLVWNADAAEGAANIGAWLFPAVLDAAPAPEPELTGARCENGALYIDAPQAEAWQRGVLPGGNYHNYDYQLFYMNIRANAVARAEAFLVRWRNQGEKPVVWGQTQAEAAPSSPASGTTVQ